MIELAEDRLRSPKLKVQRAKEHIDELESAVDLYLANNPFELVWLVDHAESRKKLIARETDKPPENIGLLIGDAAHNLRTALDHLACCLAIQNGAVIVNDVYFPISKTAEDFSKVAKHKVRKLSGEAVLMIHAMKPYGRGNELFCRLSALDNADKHRSIVTVAAAGGFRRAKFSYDHPITVNKEPRGRLDLGVLLLSVPTTAKGECIAELSSRLEVMHVPGFEGTCSIYLLREMVEMVEGVISIFERRFFS